MVNTVTCLHEQRLEYFLDLVEECWILSQVIIIQSQSMGCSYNLLVLTIIDSHSHGLKPMLLIMAANGKCL